MFIELLLVHYILQNFQLALHTSQHCSYTLLLPREKPSGREFGGIRSKQPRCVEVNAKGMCMTRQQHPAQDARIMKVLQPSPIPCQESIPTAGVGSFSGPLGQHTFFLLMNEREHQAHTI